MTLISPLYRGSGAPGAVPSLKFATSSQPEPDPLAERRALLCLMHTQANALGSGLNSYNLRKALHLLYTKLLLLTSFQIACLGSN